MFSVADSCPRGSFKIQNFLTWMREFSLNSMWSCRLWCNSPFLRLARLIFKLHDLQWRKIHALNVKGPKKVLEILVSKPFCLRKFNVNLKLFRFKRILSPSKIVNMLEAIFFLWPPVSDIEDWNWFSVVCCSFLVPSFITNKNNTSHLLQSYQPQSRLKTT